ncbi:universal stress protein [Halorubrum tibetense]|uniref:Universal stress protein n=1 Tax=Halorubrum tibetense TaxID=175631 RepID=A0ABD5S902_9EURY
MTKRILVAVDGSDAAAEAVTFAAEEWPDAHITALHVINPADSTTGAEGGFPGAIDQWYDSASQRGERILADAADRVDREIDTRIEVGRPTATILEVAAGEADDAGPFDHIVLASRGRTGLSRVVLGSVAEGVVRRAEVPVTVVR